MHLLNKLKKISADIIFSSFNPIYTGLEKRENEGKSLAVL